MDNFFIAIRHSDTTHWQGMKHDFCHNNYWYQPLYYPPSPWVVVPHHRGLCPLLFTKSSVGTFTSYKNQNSERSWDGAYDFSSLSKKTRMT